MKPIAGIFACVLSFAAFVFPAAAQSDANEMLKQIDAIGWKAAPETARVTSEATMSLVGDLRYLDREGTTKFIVLNGNPAPSVPTYTLAPRIPTWFAIFTFEASGYIKDDESIDADALLATLKKKQRRRQ